jgi:hypothetical protein
MNLFDAPIDATPPDLDPGELRVSATLLENYSVCGAKAWGAFTKQEQPKSFALVRGSAVHDALEQFAKFQADPTKAYIEAFHREAEFNQLSVNGPFFKKELDEGRPMVAAGEAILRKDDFYKRIDPELVESWFEFRRDGVLFKGKLDLLHFSSPTRYTIIDYKTGKKAPKQFDLDHKIQFLLYCEGTSKDPALKTYGLWPERCVWMHLRGVNLSEKRRKPGETPTEERFQFAFDTRPTREDVATVFTETIDPMITAMKAGLWPRIYSEACNWCGFFKKSADGSGSGVCTVKLPGEMESHE